MKMRDIDVIGFVLFAIVALAVALVIIGATGLTLYEELTVRLTATEMRQDKLESMITREPAKVTESLRTFLLQLNNYLGEPLNNPLSQPEMAATSKTTQGQGGGIQ